MATIVNPAPSNPPQAEWYSDPRFLDPLIVEELDGGNFRVEQEFDYHTDVYPLVVIHIPPCFVTDFVSSPRFTWFIVPPNGPYGKASVVHDYLYRTRGVASKVVADLVFLEAMKALGVGRVKRYAMYWAVRLFGGPAYKGGL